MYVDGQEVLTFKIIASVAVPIRTMSFVRDRLTSSVEVCLRAHVADAMSLSFPCSFSAKDPADMAHVLRWCVDIMRRSRRWGRGKLPRRAISQGP